MTFFNKSLKMSFLMSLIKCDLYFRPGYGGGGYGYNGGYPGYGGYYGRSG
jgi:hypothetical protein